MTNTLPKMFCPKCKAGRYRNEKYCYECSTKLEIIRKVNDVPIEYDDEL